MKTTALFCALALFATLVQAQTPDAPYGITVNVFHSENPQDDQLEKEIIAAIEQQLDQRAIPQRGGQQIILLVDAQLLTQAQEVVLSVSVLHALPPEVLDLGAAEEVFYLGKAGAVQPVNLTEEGRTVRQYVSRDWLAQFHHITAQKLLVFPRDRLAAEMEALVADVTGR